MGGRACNQRNKQGDGGVEHGAAGERQAGRQTTVQCMHELICAQPSPARSTRASPNHGQAGQGSQPAKLVCMHACVRACLFCACMQVVAKLFGEGFFDMQMADGSDYAVHVRLVGLPISDTLRELR